MVSQEEGDSVGHTEFLLGPRLLDCSNRDHLPTKGPEASNCLFDVHSSYLEWHPVRRGVK